MNERIRGDNAWKRRGKESLREREDIRGRELIRSTSFFFFCLLSEYLRMEIARVDTREEIREREDEERFH